MTEDRLPWFRICDGFAFHPKTVKAKNEACGAWARMGAWSRQNRTDGVVPAEMALLIAGRRLVITRLITAGFLEVEGDGYRMHDFGDYNPPAEVDEERREHVSNVRREAGRRGGLRSGEARREATKQNGSNGEAQPNHALEQASSKPEPPIPVPIPIPDPEHTHGARARALPDSPEARQLLAALERFAALGSGVATAEFAEVLEGRRMNTGRAVEHLEQAIADAAADTLPGETVETKRKRVRHYCDRARPSTARAAPSPGVSWGGAWGLQVFAEAYVANRRRNYGAYVPEPGDEARAAELVAHARTIAGADADDSRVRELVRFWAREYLRDDGTKYYLLEQRHALRHLARGIPAYGVPWGKKKAPPAPPEPPPHTGPFVPPPPEARAALAGLGIGGPTRSRRSPPAEPIQEDEEQLATRAALLREQAAALVDDEGLHHEGAP